MNRKKLLSLAIPMLMLGLISQNELFAASSKKSLDQINAPDKPELQTRDNVPAWKGLKHFVSQSDITFRGVVTDIQYKLADPTEQGQAYIPYTFITYDVKEMIHGNFAGKQVVLRFIGGLDERTMRYMGASNVPNFDLGDEDILFVEGNTKSMSPLVLNDRGRFRVIGGQVFSNNGREITINGKGQLQYGKRHRLEEILTTTVSGSQGTMVMDHKLSPDAVQQASHSITAEALTKKIRGMALPNKVTTQFANADIHKALTGPSMKPASAPKPVSQGNVKSIDPQSLEESTEIGEMTSQRQPRN